MAHRASMTWQLILVGAVLAAGCRHSPDRARADDQTTDRVIAWDQHAPTVQDAARYTHQARFDTGVRAVVTQVSCTGEHTPYNCQGHVQIPKHVNTIQLAVVNNGAELASSAIPARTPSR